MTNIIKISNKKELSPEQSEELFRILKARFEKNMNRHKDIESAKVKARLEANTDKLWSLNEMEKTAIDMATAMDIELLTEEQYQELQKLGNFDMKTSS